MGPTGTLQDGEGQGRTHPHHTRPTPYHSQLAPCAPQIKNRMAQSGSCGSLVSRRTCAGLCQPGEPGVAVRTPFGHCGLWEDGPGSDMGVGWGMGQCRPISTPRPSRPRNSTERSLLVLSAGTPVPRYSGTEVLHSLTHTERGGRAKRASHLRANCGHGCYRRISINDVHPASESSVLAHHRHHHHHHHRTYSRLSLTRTSSSSPVSSLPRSWSLFPRPRPPFPSPFREEVSFTPVDAQNNRLHPTQVATLPQG